MLTFFPFSKPRLVDVIWAILATVALAVLIDYLIIATDTLLSPPEEIRNYQKNLLDFKSTQELIVKSAFMTILPSFCEEILFRGFCQTALTHYLGTRRGVVIAALLFALAHTNIWYLHLYFLLGLFLGTLFAISRNLWIPIIAHFTNNLWTILAHYFGIGP